MQRPIPTTVDDLKRMITDQAQEDLHLDYKSSPALQKRDRDEIAKDVSAMANADGGLIIYGVEEEGHLPVQLDEGVPDSTISREWLDNILSSRISPAIPDLQIRQIPGQDSHSYFVIAIPKSYSGPHQAPTKRYYKRYNFRSSPMDDYEIRDIHSRQRLVSRLVAIDVTGEHLDFSFTISNPGTQPAEDVSFSFSQKLAWDLDKAPRAFEQGIKYLPPGRELRFWYGSGYEVLREEAEGPIEFSVTAEYFHPDLQRRHGETFYFDFRDFLGASGYREPYKVIADEVKKGFRDIVRAIKEVSTSRR